MLERFVSEKGWTVSGLYVDDGWSGTTFDRPDFQRMIDDIEQGKINCVLTKDLSRFGRNYIQAGYYLDYYFPEKGVRYIAVHDQYDSENGDNDIAPFRNIVNEWYSRDQSKKIKAAQVQKVLNGKNISTFPPYGYIKDPKTGQFIIDEETAPVIRKMFDMAGHGSGSKKILKYLYNEKVKTPSALINERYGVYGHLFRDREDDARYQWSLTQIAEMLKNEVYLGHTISFRKGTISYKNRKAFTRPKEEWHYTYNTHEPLVSQELFDMAQKARMTRCKNSKEKSEPHLFAGIARCADCGATMRYNNRIRIRKDGTEKDSSHMFCRQYSTMGKEHCSNHYVNYPQFCELILQLICKWASLVDCDEGNIVKKLLAETEQEGGIDSGKAEQRKIRKRLMELEKLFTHLYEDRVSGAISEGNYTMLSQKYQNEQKDLETREDRINRMLTEKKETETSIQKWLDLIRQYKNITELSRYTIYELFERIEIGQGYEANGTRIQQIDVYFRFVGNIEAKLAK